MIKTKGCLANSFMQKAYPRKAALSSFFIFYCTPMKCFTFSFYTSPLALQIWKACIYYEQSQYAHTCRHPSAKSNLGSQLTFRNKIRLMFNWMRDRESKTLFLGKCAIIIAYATKSKKPIEMAESWFSLVCSEKNCILRSNYVSGSKCIPENNRKACNINRYIALCNA